MKRLLKLAKAATQGDWVVNWFICRADADDVKAKTAKKIGEELWRVPWSIGPISCDENYWAGSHISCEQNDIDFILSANPETVAKLAEIAIAAKNLVDVKGRHHTGQAYEKLEALVNKL